MQQTKQLYREYASVAGSSDEVQKACVVRAPCVSMTPLKTRSTDAESHLEANYVKDGSPVLQSVKTLAKKNCGNQTVRRMTERLGNVSGKVGKMKVEVALLQPRKQIMRNSFEQAKSRRHFTANVENKWFSNLHKNVNSTIINKCETRNLMFSNLHENANSALYQNSNMSPKEVYLNQENAIYRCQGNYHSMPSVHKWLLIFSQTLINPRISSYTLICLPKSLHASMSLQPALRIHRCLSKGYEA